MNSIKTVLTSILIKRMTKERLNIKKDFIKKNCNKNGKEWKKGIYKNKFCFLVQIFLENKNKILCDAIIMQATTKNGLFYLLSSLYPLSDQLLKGI